MQRWKTIWQKPGINIFTYQWRSMSVLLGWAVGSVAAGALWLRDEAAFWRGFGLQCAAWGAVDGLIALVGLRGAFQNARKLEQGKLNQGEHARRARQFERILWINAGLDVLYMLSGLWLLRQDDDNRRGMGWGIMLQGGFLFVFDALNGLIVNRQR